MDERCREVMSQFISQESALKCLELCGYTNLQVLQSITEDELDAMEQFIRDTCKIMSKDERTEYVGAIFSDNPELFRFPIGIRKSILLGVGTSKATTVSQNKSVQTYITWENLLVEAQNQLVVSMGMMPSIQSPSLPGMFNGSNLCSFPFGFPNPNLTQLAGFHPNVMDLLSAGNKIPQAHTPNTKSFYAMGQHNSQSQQQQQLMSSKLPKENGSANNVATKVENGVKCEERMDSSPTSQVPKLIPAPCINGKASSPSIPLISNNNNISHSPNSTQSPPSEIGDSDIDVDKLKSRSSASVLRLSSKQFENAQLQEGTDFEIQLEIQPCEDGGRRVSGVYQCHLCKVKRDRTSAVRFSIAKNRYPVVSNIMSHLKMHFSQRPVASQSPLESQAASSMMQMSSFPSMVPMGSLQQLNAFWSPAFKTPNSMMTDMHSLDAQDQEAYSNSSPWVSLMSESAPFAAKDDAPQHAQTDDLKA